MITNLIDNNLYITFENEDELDLINIKKIFINVNNEYDNFDDLILNFINIKTMDPFILGFLLYLKSVQQNKNNNLILRNVTHTNLYKRIIALKLQSVFIFENIHNKKG
jgi:anti-anti-sigma regulatory factor